MRTLIILVILGAALAMQGCGNSSYTDSTNSTTEVDVFQVPKADCGGDPCL